ncbi:MAG TPA: TOBE domain-containing protein, partial [bacterium]|nr:TOBE domain-containing protein [bacterium]
ADAEGPGTVLRRLFQGSEVIYCVQLPSGRKIHSMQPHTAGLVPGARVTVTLTPGHVLTCFHDGRAVPAEVAGHRSDALDPAARPAARPAQTG